MLTIADFVSATCTAAADDFMPLAAVDAALIITFVAAIYVTPPRHAMPLRHTLLLAICRDDAIRC